MFDTFRKKLGFKVGQESKPVESEIQSRESKKVDLIKKISKQFSYLLPRIGVANGTTNRIGGYGYGPVEDVPVFDMSFEIDDEMTLEVSGTGKEGIYGGGGIYNVSINGILINLSELDEEILDSLSIMLENRAAPFRAKDRFVKEELDVKFEKGEAERKKAADNAQSLKKDILDKLRRLS